MIEQILQQTTTTTSIQCPPIDWSVLISLLIGVSGIVGLTFTYLRMRESRKERTERAFRELVMTPPFQTLLSTLDTMKEMHKAISAGERGQSGSITIAGEQVTFKDRKEFDEKMIKIAPKVISTLRDARDSLAKSALKQLLPKKLETMFMEALKSTYQPMASGGNFDATDKKFRELYAEIRKMAGFEQLE